MKTFLIGSALAIVALIAVTGSSAWADPLPGEVLKFYQTPLNNGLAVLPPQGYIPPGSAPAPWPGHDEYSTAFLQSPSNYQGTYMADDFADNLSTPIVHVMWWGSYLNNLRGNNGVQKFLIAFETDVPADAPGNTLGYSHPGTVISSQVVTFGALSKGSGTFTEAPVTPGTLGPASPDGTLYQYNAELSVPAPEQANQVEWLKIVALVDPGQGNIAWGWHDRDWGIQDPLASPLVIPGERNENPGAPPNVWHFQDDAVFGGGLTYNTATNTLTQSEFFQTFYTPASDGVNFSKDLAFALYTVPEPSSVALLTIGLATIAASRWRRSRNGGRPDGTQAKETNAG